MEHNLDDLYSGRLDLALEKVWDFSLAAMEKQDYDVALREIIQVAVFQPPTVEWGFARIDTVDHQDKDKGFLVSIPISGDWGFFQSYDDGTVKGFPPEAHFKITQASAKLYLRLPRVTQSNLSPDEYYQALKSKCTQALTPMQMVLSARNNGLEMAIRERAKSRYQELVAIKREAGAFGVKPDERRWG